MVKTPVVPFHTWLPDAHTEAPTAGSIDLAGVLLKLGTYGFMRYGLYLFPEATVWAAPVMLTLAVIGIIYGAIVAAMQKNLKRLVAYSSVSHMGFAILGLFALTTQGLEGSILVMINHGITTGALFILLGFLYTRRHTYDIASLKGLQTVAPVFAGLFTIVMLSSIGVPGLNGFVGEFLVLLGTFVSHRWWAVVAATGVILAALYMLWAYQRVFHGEPDDANRDMPDLKLTERLVMVPLVAADRVPRRLPEAGARAHPAVGRAPARARRGGQPGRRALTSTSPPPRTASTSSRSPTRARATTTDTSESGEPATEAGQ